MQLTTHVINSPAVGKVISGICDFVCVCLRCRSKMASAVHTKLGIHVLLGSGSSCINPEVKRSRSHGYESCHSCMAASEVCCCGCRAAATPGMGLHVV